MSIADKGTLLLTGATGYLGSLVITDLLCEGQYRIVASLRSSSNREKLIEKINLELARKGMIGEIDFERLLTVELPTSYNLESMRSAFQKFDINEIIHCAGSVDYFDCA